MQPNNPTGWIYVNADLSHPDICKVGETGGDLNKRTGPQTANTNYMFIVGFHVSDGDVRAIERIAQREIGYGRLPHLQTGSRSEWFDCSPQIAVNNLKHHISKNIGLPINEDGHSNLAKIAVLADISKDCLLLLASRGATKDQVINYYNAVNGVRSELDLPLIPWTDPYNTIIPKLR